MEIEENGRTYVVEGDYPNGKYAKALKIAPAPIRKIRQDAFLDRFTPIEQAKIEGSEDISMRVFKNNAVVVVRPYINLDHGLVQYALPVLRDAGVLDGDTEQERQARMDAILADGTEDEAKGVVL